MPAASKALSLLERYRPMGTLTVFPILTIDVPASLERKQTVDVPSLNQGRDQVVTKGRRHADAPPCTVAAASPIQVQRGALLVGLAKICHLTMN